MWVAPLMEGDWTKATLKPLNKKRKANHTLTGGNKKVVIDPVLRHATLLGQILFLKGPGALEDKINLRGCEIMSISGGEKAGRKW